jgi:pimeloyl-ACP methyl ester carboxylesterase
MPGAGRIMARLLLVHDRDDDIAPHAHSAELAAQLPAARFITTVDQGHSKLTREASTVALIADFIAPPAATP